MNVTVIIFIDSTTITKAEVRPGRSIKKNDLALYCINKGKGREKNIWHK